MGPETIPKGIKALIFKDRNDYYKASGILFEEYRRRPIINSENPGFIAALQGNKEGFYYVMLMVPASFVPCIEKKGIDYTELKKEEAEKFMTEESARLLSGNGGGLERLC